jgi:hypothetical protein
MFDHECLGDSASQRSCQASRTSAVKGVTTVTSDKFFAGLIAAIRTIKDDEDASPYSRLTANRVSLNRAFYQAITGPKGEFVDRKQLAIDYDPLYGVSPWFERALTRAQRDLLISFPNPTYSVVEIKLKKDQAERLLERTGQREEFTQLAQAFIDNMKT